jgi:hypothetical protein
MVIYQISTTKHALALGYLGLATASMKDFKTAIDLQGI